MTFNKFWQELYRDYIRLRWVWERDFLSIKLMHAGQNDMLGFDI